MDDDIKQRVQAAIAAGAPPEEAQQRGLAIQAQRTSSGSFKPAVPSTSSAPENTVRATPSILQGNARGENLVSGDGFLPKVVNTLAKPFVKTGQNIAGAGYELYRGAKSAMGDQNAYYNNETGQVKENPFLSTETLQKINDDPASVMKDQIKNSITMASYAVPFGKAGFVGSKAVVPGAVVGAAQSLPEAQNAEDVVRGGIYGGVTAGVLQGAGAVANKAKDLITKKMPKRIMDSVFKETVKDTRKAIKTGDTLGQQALDRGGNVGTTEGLYTKAVQKINDTEDSLQSLLMEGKGRVKFSNVEKDLKSYLEELKQAGNPVYQTIKDRIDLLKKTNGSSIPDVQANQIKRTLYDEVQKSYGIQGKPEDEGLKLIAKSIKDQIGTNNPQILQMNKDLSFYGRQANSMVDKMTRDQRNNLFGLSDIPFAGGAMVPGMQLPAIGGYLAKKVAGSTIGKTAIATGLNMAGKALDKLPAISPKVIQAGGQMTSRLPSIGQQPDDSSINQEKKKNTDTNHDTSVAQPDQSVQQKYLNPYGMSPEELYTSAIEAKDVYGDTKAYTARMKMYTDETAYQKAKGSEPITIDRFVDKLSKYYFYDSNKSLSQGKNTVGVSGIPSRLGVETKKLTDQKYADNLKQFTDMRSIFAGMLNRARGAGTLNAGEYETVIQNMPNEYTSESAAKSWFENTKELLKGIDISKAQVSISAE